jgi:hypothetical protein
MVDVNVILSLFVFSLFAFAFSSSKSVEFVFVDTILRLLNQFLLCKRKISGWLCFNNEYDVF